MKKYFLALALLVFTPSALAEFVSEPVEKPVVFNEGPFLQIEEDDTGMILLEWETFVPKNGETFAWYKVLKSEGNNNPIYPHDPTFKVVGGVENTVAEDWIPEQGAFYRVCAITQEEHRYCGNVVWVEGEENDPKKDYHKYQNERYEEEYEDEPYEEEYTDDEWELKAEQEAEREAQQKREEELERQAKIRAEEARVEAERRAEEQKQKILEEQQEREASLQAEKAKAEEEAQEEKEARAEAIEAQKKKDLLYQKHTEKDLEKPEAKLSAKVIDILERWIEKLGQKFRASTLPAGEKVEKLDELQEKLFEMAKSKPTLWPVYDFLKPRLGTLKKEFEQEDQFDGLEDFLNNLDI